MATKFAEILRALEDESTALSRAMLRRLSNLGESDRQTLYAGWGAIPRERRCEIIRQLAEIIDTDFDTDFTAVTRLALTDLSEEVREAAIEASWPDETPYVFNRLLPMAAVDSSVSVRASAMSALGRFILLGELGKFDASLARQAQNLAIRLYGKVDEDTDVRRRALEALSNSSRVEVGPMIRESYESDNARMRISAVYAMGRSCDERWSEVVIHELGSDDPAMRYEAVRAAGELELEEAVPLIGPMLRDPDRQIMEAAIWSLGEIGGAEARRFLSTMLQYAEDKDDQGLMEMVEDAIASAGLVGSGLVFDS
jgi:HEAT repeat protein